MYFFQDVQVIQIPEPACQLPDRIGIRIRIMIGIRKADKVPLQEY